MAESDHELMQRCRRGDPAAFELLVRRWESSVMRIVAGIARRRTSGGVADVEDLSQEVFLRVLAARERYHNGCSFSTWLYRIAVNVARDANRRSRTRQHVLEHHRPERALDDAAEIASRRETAREVAAALNTLPDKLREPLVLKQFADMTFAEVAEVLNLPASTVKSRVHAALIKLRVELERRGVVESE
jgi:RNA polymerase sigma-70 factor (ECF subfamily)